MEILGLLAFMFFLLPLIAIVMVIGAKADVKALKLEIVALKAQIASLTGDESAQPEPSSEPAATTKEQPAEDAATPAPIAHEIESVPAREADALITEIDDEPREEEAAAPPPTPNEAVVFTKANQARLSKWLADYWTYALGALSLALAGIYIVRLGMERGYFPPIFRILSAVAFGGALIAVAERLRNWGGDQERDFTAYLPSTIAAAGFTTLFAAVLGAHSLYGLIGADLAFIGLVAVAIFAILSGWRYGALLSALGIFGAFFAPFLVSPGSAAGYIMFAYALLVLAIGLFVDSAKRTGWLSLWAMVASFTFAFLVFGAQPVQDQSLIASDIYQQSYLAFGFVFLIFVAVIPERKLIPDFAGNGLLEFFIGKVKTWPAFPVRLIELAMAGLVTIFVIVMAYGNMWMMISAVALLGALCFFWLARSPALGELGLVPLGLALFALFAIFGLENFDVTKAIAISLLGIVFSLAAAIASIKYSQNQNIWRGVSLLYPFAYCLSLLAFELYRRAPLEWLICFAAFAGLTAYLTFEYYRRFGLLSRFVALGALLLWGYGLIFLWVYVPAPHFAFAFALMIAVPSLLYIKTGWGLHDLAVKIATPIAIGSMATVYGQINHWLFIAELALLAAGAYLLFTRLKDKDVYLRVHFEAWGMLIGFAAIALAIWEVFSQWGSNNAYALAGVYYCLAAAQSMATFHRARFADKAALIRKAIAYVYLCIAAILALSLFVFIPLFGWRVVFGFVIVNDMLLGYFFPALITLAIARFTSLGARARRTLYILSASLFALWALMNIRMFWQGSGGISLWRPTSQGELFTYSLVMLIATIAIMAQSLRATNPIWRRLAYGALLLTGAKIYLIDLAQVEGFLRVAALFFFGVIMITYAFLERKLRGQDQEALQTSEEN